MTGDMGAFGVWIGTSGLSSLMPMHLLLSLDGRVIHAGPTLVRVLDAPDLIGTRFEDLFDVRAPGGATTVEEVLARAGHRFRLVPRNRSRIGLRGVGVRLPGGEGVLLNLSFGIDLIAAVREFGLTDADFAATDLAMELLYLAEANAAVTRELRGLNLRLEGARIAAEEDALTDPLTGLRNRRAADLFLDQLCASGAPFGLLQMDLDFFKAVNDTLGHAAGDFVLETVGAILRAHTRAEDCVARIGGDEFLVILPGRTEARVADGFRGPKLPRLGQHRDRTLDRHGQARPRPASRRRRPGALRRQTRRPRAGLAAGTGRVGPAPCDGAAQVRAGACRTTPMKP